MSQPAFEVRIRADKSGERANDAWPVAGFEIVGDPPATLDLPMSWVTRYQDAPWLKVVAPGWVERPSRPNPVEGKKGSAEVAPDHRAPAGALPPPHAFLHVERIVFDTLNHGKVEYLVEQQPDKYLDKGEGKEKPTEPVTLEQYEAGNTRVDWFYHLTLKGAKA